MAHAHHHAVSSARRWGGTPEDYVHVHEWFDESKQHYPDRRHRALRHHAEGIAMAETIFGRGLTIRRREHVPGGAEGDTFYVPIRWIGEQHVKEDLGWIPTVKDWLQHVDFQPWMRGRSSPDMRRIERGSTLPSLEPPADDFDSRPAMGAAFGWGSSKK